jgi:exosortase
MTGSRRESAVALVIAAVLAALYVPILATLWHVWLTDTYAAHGVVVAPFSAWVAFGERERLRVTPRRPDPRGWLAILLGLAVLGAGWALGSPALQAVSVPVVVAGWVLLSFGAAPLRVLAFPVGFLVFLAPLPRPIVGACSLQLQTFAAWFAAQVAGLFGVPVYQEGVVIQTVIGPLQVAELCNGLRFMTALVVLTVALAYTLQLGLARQLLLVASAVPLAVLANATRVAAIVVGAYFYGPKVASGLIHHSIGKVVWILTLVPLGLLAWWLRRGLSDRGTCV